MDDLLSFDPEIDTFDVVTDIEPYIPLNTRLSPSPSEASVVTTQQTTLDENKDAETVLHFGSSTFTAPLIEILNKYERKTIQLFVSLETIADGKMPERFPARIIKEIIDLDRSLQEGVAKVQEHQRYHQKLLLLENAIDDENDAIMLLIECLELGKEPIEEMLEDAKITKKAIKMAQESPMTIEDILEYATKVSHYTSGAIERPYPDETKIRLGILYRRYIEAKGISVLQESKDGERAENQEEDGEDTDEDDQQEETEEDEDNESTDDGNQSFNLELPEPSEIQDNFDLDLNPDME
ncbi:hypothetical protein G9A89_022416 [Geosiphon pyriformis]|nr:hypothetical protein G9A89_022416 [Geosiphon pyriformis]